MLKVLFYYEFKSAYFTVNFVKLLWTAAFLNKFWLKWLLLVYLLLIGM